MSQEINNSEYRAKMLKEMLALLNNGETVDEVKKLFQKTFKNVSATEISLAEQSLIEEGLPVEEIQKLCDVHATLFEGEVMGVTPQKEELKKIPGHPVHTFLLENQAINKLLNDIEKLSPKTKETAIPLLQQLWQIDLHYKRKENLYFPFLENYGITAPPKVMWGVDDEIRASLKKALFSLQDGAPDADFQIAEAIQMVRSMIKKEEEIFLPMSLEHFTTEDWIAIAAESDEIGYTFIENIAKWPDQTESNATRFSAPVQETNGLISFSTGTFDIEQLENILNLLPIDITFVDEKDQVRYFSRGKERIFPRTKAILGRNVENCHPPQSVHVVEELLSDFKRGTKDSEDFWLQIQDKFILIRYFAVRSPEGKYLGTLEVTQNIAPLKTLAGEKRLIM